jgi:wyosine [tRNA(Phe)-imidazoG37] synthetase (radical SAM superfamily)
VKLLTPLPVAVITNGALLYLPEVREELASADAVLPSLDAGTAALYRRINRPHPDITFEGHIEGIKAFRKEYQGKLWVEVMLMNGVNDTEEALKRIAALLEEIRPDEIHILQPTRPPAETWVKPADDDGLLRARALLGKSARVIDPAHGSFDLSEGENLVDAIVGIITRHPMRETELVDTLTQFSDSDVFETLNELAKSGKAQVVTRYGVRFWSASPAHYPANGQGTKDASEMQDESQ